MDILESASHSFWTAQKHIPIGPIGLTVEVFCHVVGLFHGFSFAGNRFIKQAGEAETQCVCSWKCWPTNAWWLEWEVCYDCGVTWRVMECCMGCPTSPLASWQTFSLATLWCLCLFFCFSWCFNTSFGWQCACAQWGFGWEAKNPSSSPWRGTAGAPTRAWKESLLRLFCHW